MGHVIRRVLGGLLDNRRFGGAVVDTMHAYLDEIRHADHSGSLGERLDDHDSAFEIDLALRLLKAFKSPLPVRSVAFAPMSYDREL